MVSKPWERSADFFGKVEKRFGDDGYLKNSGTIATLYFVAAFLLLK